ncbi:hypothetical protein ACKKBG_A31560 [Auxenochlorella protothecoides x Auxenochlorella symbiontica]
MTGLEAHRAPGPLSDIGSLWFPGMLAGFAALITLHGLLGVLGASFDWPALLHMMTGLSLALIPVEAAWLAVSHTQLAWLERVARHDGSGALAALLDQLEAHPHAARVAGIALAALQLLGSCLGAAAASHAQARHRYPWSSAWEGGGRGASPARPRLEAATGYYTPQSRPGTPEASPMRLPRSVRRPGATSPTLPGPEGEPGARRPLLWPTPGRPGADIP